MTDRVRESNGSGTLKLDRGTWGSVQMEWLKAVRSPHLSNGGSLVWGAPRWDAVEWEPGKF